MPPATSATVSPEVSGAGNRPRLAQREIIKAIVYTLLVINLGLYFQQDWLAAEKMLLRTGFSLIEFARRFSTTLDDFAWLVLLLIYELESAWIEGTSRGPLHWLRRAAFVLCYAVIVSVLCGYALEVHATYGAAPIAGTDSACALADRDLYYLYNQDYTEIRSSNCAQLGSALPYFRLHDGSITDAHGFSVAMLQAWLSASESALWLLLVISVALMLALQARGNAEGLAIRCGTAVNYCCYALIMLMTLYWASMGHYVYLWDNTLWIGGFVIIETNLSAWRRELLADPDPSAA